MTLIAWLGRDVFEQQGATMALGQVSSALFAERGLTDDMSAAVTAVIDSLAASSAARAADLLKVSYLSFLYVNTQH